MLRVTEDATAVARTDKSKPATAAGTIRDRGCLLHICLTHCVRQRPQRRRRLPTRRRPCRPVRAKSLIVSSYRVCTSRLLTRSRNVEAQAGGAGFLGMLFGGKASAAASATTSTTSTSAAPLPAVADKSAAAPLKLGACCAVSVCARTSKARAIGRICAGDNQAICGIVWCAHTSLSHRCRCAHFACAQKKRRSRRS
jgi:hypothetical protein